MSLTALHEAAHSVVVAKLPGATVVHATIAEDDPHVRTRVYIGSTPKDQIIGFKRLAAKIKERFGDQQVVLVPVPSNKTTADSPPDFRTALMAAKIAEHRSAVVDSALRFKKEMLSTREGGEREPAL